MVKKIQETYKAQFEGEPLLVRAPGRINLIGEHTDYNNGFVMPAAIDKAMYFAIGKNPVQQTIQIKAMDYNELVVLNADERETLPSWARYFQAIIDILLEKGHDLSGVNCLFASDIPIGAGLSSSAALCCGFIFGLSELLDLNFSRREIALIGQSAEHRIGLNCGLMDQYAVLFGKKDQVFRLDCQDLAIDYFPMQLRDYSIVLIDSKIEHQLEGSPYNDRRESCERVVGIIAKTYPAARTLRDVSRAQLDASKAEIDPLDYQRANYVLEENNRVRRMMEALNQGALEEAGSILLEGHQGMSKEYNISLPEIDLLVDLARQEAGVLGARMMGGGFGGCTINLVANANKKMTLQRIKSKYQDATHVEPAVHIINISDGVNLLPKLS